jgi:predicted permease
MLGVIEGFVIILIVIGSGIVLSASKVLPENAHLVVNRFVYYLGYPFLMFKLISEKHLSDIFDVDFLVFLLSSFVIAGLFLLINHFFMKEKSGNKIISMMASSYANSNNIGLPVATFVLSQPTAVIPLLLFQQIIFSPLILGSLEINRQDSETSKIKLILSPFKNPIIVGTILGIIASAINLQLPVFFSKPVEMISDVAVPSILISYGMSLVGVKFLENKKGIQTIAINQVLKLILLPATAFCIAKFGFNLDDSMVYTVTILSALPTAQNVYNYAVAFDTAKEVARDNVLVSTIISPFIIVAIALLFGH